MKPVEFRRRIVNGFAVQVTHDNSTEVAKWCGAGYSTDTLAGRRERLWLSPACRSASQGVLL